MNYALAREIYGGQPWMVDRLTFSAQSAMLKDFRNGVVFEKSGVDKLNCHYLVDVKSGTRVVGTIEKSNGESTDQKVSIIKLNGPIVKNGGMSSFGMKDLADEILTYDADPQIIGHIILADSGGGSAAGMEVMVHAIDQLKKPKVSVVERGGVAASAAYGIVAHTDRIFAESAKSTVGSIGSMISFAAQPNKSVNANGEKQVTIYATPSTKKNLWFEEALNNDNYELAISEILDPHVEDFRQDMRNQRAKIKETELDGSVYNAEDVIGTLVDEIGGIKEAISYIKAQPDNKITINNKNQSISAMTAQELLAQHPSVHAEILGAGRAAGVQAGIAAEKDRTGAWMAHLGTDPEAVKKGIEGGGAITATAREEFLVKASAKVKLDAVKNDSAPATQPAEAESSEKTEDQKFYDGVLAGMKGDAK